jgi:hypothetical protein
MLTRYITIRDAIFDLLDNLIDGASKIKMIILVYL